MEDKITIIEGPPPTFEENSEMWVEGVTDALLLNKIAFTKLRTFNGEELVERCRQAWREQHAIYLEYRTFEGLEKRAPIVAARSIETDDGDVLLLWVRITDESVELDFSYDDDFDLDDGEDDDLDLGAPLN